MSRFRFSLRQALLAVAVVAVLLVIARYTLRTRTGTTVAIAVAVSIGILAAANVVICSALRVVGQMVPPDIETTGKAQSPVTQPADAAPHDTA